MTALKGCPPTLDAPKEPAWIRLPRLSVHHINLQNGLQPRAGGGSTKCAMLVGYDAEQRQLACVPIR